MKRHIELKEVELPEFGMPEHYPDLPGRIYERRIERLRQKARGAGLDIVVVYGDREHFANISYLCGVDPRFEEALLVVHASNAPFLITGPENQTYALSSPIDLSLKLYPPFGLLGQERRHTPNIDDLFREVGISEGMTIGVIGWKYFTSEETDFPQSWLEIPSYVADTLRTLAGEGNVLNATELLMNPSTGLRSENEVEQIVQFEYAACHVSEAVKRVLFSLKPGRSERDLADCLRLGRLPLSCHPMISSGERTRFGLASPSDKAIQLGEPIQIAIGVWGALTCRAGWVASGPEDLPTEVQDYVERLARPYFACAVAWYETIGLGVTGGELDALVKAHLGDPFFGVSLNPGHLIHHDEWMSTPIYPSSTETLRSGHAVQLDIIPATGTAYGTANVEDGAVLLDETGRAELRDRFPDVWERIEERREFMSASLGINLRPEVLPLSNLAGCWAPFMLCPSRVLVARTS